MQRNHRNTVLADGSFECWHGGRLEMPGCRKYRWWVCVMYMEFSALPKLALNGRLYGDCGGGGWKGV